MATRGIGNRPLRIAMVGQKGLPATFGGIERHVEEIGSRLAERGHEVTVYCRASYGTVERQSYRGMRLEPAYTVGTKHLDTIVHGATSTAKALRRGVDILHYHGLGLGILTPWPTYATRAKVVLTVHGLDHQRGKWASPVPRLALGAAHQLTGRVPDRVVVVSRALQEHYQQTFGRAVDYITNGVPISTPVGSEEIEARFGLEPGRYALFVGRLVPEKRPDLLIEAFKGVDTDAKLVIAGDSSFTDEFSSRLRALAAQDPRVVFTGFVFGDTLTALYQHAAAFVQPSELEGLPLTLLEAIVHGSRVIVSDIQPHLEVLGELADSATVVPVGRLAPLREALGHVLATPAPLAVELQKSVLEEYSWDAAADKLERIYRNLTG